MTWIWLALIGVGILWVGSGIVLVLWSVLQTVLLLFRRDEWRDYPELHESLRKARRRWRQ